MTRSVGASPNTRTITAENSYDDAGRLVRTDLGNGNWIERDYDDADRLTRIAHKHASGRTMLQLAYDWTPDGLIEEITETDNTTVIGEAITATVSYEYDYRNRLTREIRVDSGATGIPEVEFDIEYTYDLGGNRLSKVEHHSGLTTLYHYDVSEDPEDVGGQHNNRLLSQETYDSESELVDQRWYRYGSEGHLSRLVRRVAGWTDDAVYWFYYDTSGRLWLAVDGAGTYDDEEDELSDTVFGIAAEYRYDGGRQRYMVRLRDPNDDWAVMSDGDWTDYLGDSVHRNYTVTPDSGTATDGVSRLAGVGYDDGGEDGPMYYASDQIGSARRISDSQGCGTGVPPVCSPALVARRIYSAFGELVDTANSGSFNALHYGYAGAYGYEEANANALDPLAQLGWLHVGERYYAPELGRFVQRDPIGIRGGVNTYVYARNCVTSRTDPSGLTSIIDDIDNLLNVVITGDMLAGTGAGVVVLTAANYKWKLAIGRLLNRSSVVCAGIWIGWRTGKVVVNNTPFDEGIGWLIFQVDNVVEEASKGPPIGPVFIQPFQPVTSKEAISGRHYYGNGGCGCPLCAGA